MSNTTENFLAEITCKVCGKRNNHKRYKVREMQYGTKEEFDYFVCEECNCIQITGVPVDLGKYYGDDYYSKSKLEIPCFGECPIYTEKSYLDVGCGSGEWLLEMAKKGYGNLYGCDPFIENELKYGDRVHIKKCEIAEMEGEYDVIRFGDSFEHMDNPLEVMENIKRLLKKDGQCIIKMPVFPNSAFDTFGVHWYQLDAPRHLIVHSVKSMKYLCDKFDLKIENIEYDSLWGQFGVSYLYELGIPMIAQVNELVEKAFTEEDVQYFLEKTKEVNEKGYGDHAIFYIRH